MDSLRTNLDFPRIFQELFDDQVDHSPEAIAAICEDEQITYLELSHRANQLARHLLLCGVKPETLVGICVNRSIDMLVGILGILKAGGAYVPLDPYYPRDRLAYILSDARIEIVVTQTGLFEVFSQQEIRKICLDGNWPEIARQPETNLERTVSGDNLAYVIYTSGSTGKPKGVMITHSSLGNFIRIACQALDVTSRDVYLQTASIGYALSVRQLMISLSCGATLVIATSEQARDPYLLFELIKRRQISLMDVVPSFWRTCIQRLLAISPVERQELLKNRLRRIVSIGEALLSDIPRDWRFKLGHTAKLVNIFGQTETTGVVATYPIPPEPTHAIETVPIGRNIPETKLYILDSNLQPVPKGVMGELCISNPCLARGYLNLPELTAKKFVPNPFSSGTESRLYRTGDMARYREDGNIEFLGRSDFQVKIRGQRLELGEVEAIISECPAIRACIVVAHGEQPDEKRLIAYIIPDPGRALTVSDIQQFMKRQVPDFMMPSAYIFMDAFPLTPNGKVDRLALSDSSFIDSKLSQTEMSSLYGGIRQLPENRGFVPARNDLERTLTGIWQSLLKVERIGIYDNFFDLGGHSLLAVRMFSQVEQELGVRLSTAVILQAPTIAKLAEHLQHFETPSKELQVLVPIQPGGHRSPFYCVHGVGGSVLGYRDLVDALGNEQPFYGLQAIGLEDQIGDLSIEAMAARYVDVMRSFQPHGSYQIGGYCFGGVVAYEMACQLEKQGQEVSLLAIFEGYIPGVAGTPVSLIKRLDMLWTSIPAWIRDYASMDSDELRGRLLSTLGKFFLKFNRNASSRQKISVEEILGTDLANVPGRNIELTKVHSLAFHQYKPKPYHGVVTLFRARNRSVNEVLFGSLDPKMGWEKLAMGGVQVRMVDGFHRNIHLPPYVKSLASELGCCLKARENDLQNKF